MIEIFFSSLADPKAGERIEIFREQEKFYANRYFHELDEDGTYSDNLEKSVFIEFKSETDARKFVRAYGSTEDFKNLFGEDA